MTLYSGTCETCGQHLDWMGVWVHQSRVTDGHEPQIHWAPMERLNERGEWEPV